MHRPLKLSNRVPPVTTGMKCFFGGTGLRRGFTAGFLRCGPLQRLLRQDVFSVWGCDRRGARYGVLCALLPVCLLTVKRRSGKFSARMGGSGPRAVSATVIRNSPVLCAADFPRGPGRLGRRGCGFLRGGRIHVLPGRGHASRTYDMLLTQMAAAPIGGRLESAAGVKKAAKMADAAFLQKNADRPALVGCGPAARLTKFINK